MVTDTISDMLTRIRNATMVKHQIVQIPVTKMSVAIANILKEEGFIVDFEEKHYEQKNKLSKVSNILDREPNDFDNNYDFYESLFKENINDKLDQKIQSDEEIIYNDEPKLRGTNSPNF